jgi:hypothetical protein
MTINTSILSNMQPVALSFAGVQSRQLMGASGRGAGCQLRHENEVQIPFLFV